MKNNRTFLTFACVVIFTAVFSSELNAQTTVNRDTLIVATQEIIRETTYCALVTMDSTGQPQVRTMNPFPANNELLVKMKRDYWNGIPNWQDIFVLIKVVPRTLEVINYKHGLNNDPNTFKAPSITF